MTTPIRPVEPGPCGCWRMDCVDVRRTPEAARRAAALGHLLRFAPPEILYDEVGDA